MIEVLLLEAMIKVFKAAFAGEDLDRKVGADVVSTMISGLIRTASPADPVLLAIRDEIKKLTIAPYEQAMKSGHRYLEEARLDASLRDDSLVKARERLVEAAALAEGWNPRVPPHMASKSGARFLPLRILWKRRRP